MHEMTIDERRQRVANGTTQFENWENQDEDPRENRREKTMSSISESYRYIVRSPGVRGGNARVEGTRIGVHDVIGLLQTGETVDTLTTKCFPNLTKAQVYECLAYYEDHRGEIDLLVARQMTEASG
jgi:uncharacterized protein (DUF433 family)